MPIPLWDNYLHISYLHSYIWGGSKTCKKSIMKEIKSTFRTSFPILYLVLRDERGGSIGMSKETIKVYLPKGASFIQAMEPATSIPEVFIFALGPK